MTDSEKLDLLIESVGELKEDVSELKEDVGILKKEVSGLKEDVGILKEEVSKLKEDVSILKEKVSGLEEDVGILKEDVDSLKNDMQGVKIRIENELSVNIQRVAEGHLDLDRKLTEVIKPNSEVEILSIKVHKLEGEMKEVKAKIS